MVKMASKAHIHFVSIVLCGLLYHEAIKLSSCCTEIEKDALLKLKDGLTDPSGRLSSWSGNNCCAWRGVVCNNITRNVVELKLRNPFPNEFEGDGPNYALGGEINPSLLDLKHLEFLDLSMNNFGGAKIPDFIGSLQKLRYLNLSAASFGGTIPPLLGNLSSLIYLDLNTYFDESLENTLNWVSSLSSLKHLNLGSIDLSKAAPYWLQAINMLPNLRELHLSGCALSQLPLSFPFVNFSSLSFLDLSNNGFNTSIPHWLFSIQKLAYLDLSKNNHQGPIPDSFANMSYLQVLDLSENSDLEGRLPISLGSLCNLNTLDLSINNITGPITEFVNGLSRCSDSRLEILNLEFNKLSGFLPNSLGYLNNLKSLQLGNNFFLGSIPSSIGNLSSLNEFDLSTNKMNGTIPESLGQLSSMAALDIYENSWVGVVTEAHFLNLTSLKELSIGKYSLSPDLKLVFNMNPLWIPPFKLKFLKLRSCQLGPNFPAWLQNQNELETVILRNTRIADTIPDWFWKLDLQLNEMDFGYNQITGRVPNSLKFNPQSTVYLNWNRFQGHLPLWSSNVTALYLNNNSFSGPIPLDIGERMPLLTDLDISWNFLNGTIPLSMGKLNQVTTLVMSNNNLSGEIPQIWNDKPTLFILDLSNNSLSGVIPTSIGSLSSLMFLAMGKNHLSGELPSLQNCTNINSLDLRENRISGKLPSWLGERMPSLLVLSLRSNLFDGNIPRELCNHSSLHLLDLAENDISGSIPSCLGNLSGMASDMDSLRYEGQLLVAAKGTERLYQSTLSLVNSLDLSSNNLSGEVPDELSNLSRLVTLNLSINHLTGKIPENIGSLQRLETLDLSRNQLHGPIPPSMASITSLNHLNLSYNNLSGRIPSINQFLTLIDPTTYQGNNPSLCGPPLTHDCSNGTNHPPGGARENKDDDDGDKPEMLWFFISMAVGYVVGFWGVCGILIVKKSWRHALFRHVDNMKDRLFVFVSVNFARMQRG